MASVRHRVVKCRRWSRLESIYRELLELGSTNLSAPAEHVTRTNPRPLLSSTVVASRDFSPTGSGMDGIAGHAHPGPPAAPRPRHLPPDPLRDPRQRPARTPRQRNLPPPPPSRPVGSPHRRQPDAPLS
eukprot:7023044-Pyramimonas_sp.AAC.1